MVVSLKWERTRWKGVSKGSIYRIRDGREYKTTVTGWSAVLEHFRGKQEGATKASAPLPFTNSVSF